MTKKKQNKKSSRKVLSKNKQKKENKETEELRPFIKTLFALWVKTIAGTVLLAATLFIVSFFFLFPEPEIEVKKVFESERMASYEIQISNRSVMYIYQLTVAFRFSEKYPVTSYYLDEPQFKTGFVLKHGFVSNLRVSVGDTTSKKPLRNPIKYSSGFVANTNKLSPDSSAIIYANIDKTYKGRKEQIFPVGLQLPLRSDSYYVTFKHMPFGDFAPVAITRKGCYDFDNKKSKADNYGRKYEQMIIGPDGEENNFIIPVTKEDSDCL